MKKFWALMIIAVAFTSSLAVSSNAYACGGDKASGEHGHGEPSGQE